jgi:multicomponent Na+:H+ antiporter subunit E
VTVALYLVGVTLIWVLAWGSLTVANVVGGLAVACFVLLVSPDRPGTRGGRIAFRPMPALRFGTYVILQILKSNAFLVASVLARRARLHTGVMEVPLPECSDELVTIVSNVIALTPGTSPLHLTRHPTVLYVHVLDMRDVAATRRDVQHLADLAFDAFGPPDGREDEP